MLGNIDVNTYFDNNSGITNFSILGSQLGLLNGSEQYKIHKFSNGSTITISDKFNYVPLQGKDNYVIFNSNSDYYKVTQTSILNNENAEYKCEVSVGDINNF